MEIGREFFANVEELALFVLPAGYGAVADRPPVPDMGLVIAAKDPARSESLWNQLFTLPALLGMPQVPPAEELKMIGSLVAPLRFAAATDEAPASFAVRLEVTGLPDVSRLLRTLEENEAGLRAASRRSPTAPAEAVRR